MGLFSRLSKITGAKAPAVRVHEAFNGAIRVYETPLGSEWSADEAFEEGDGFLKYVLKYKLPGEPLSMVLSAKLYVLHEDLGAPPDPASTAWSAEFATFFATAPTVATSTTQQLLMRGTLPAAEALVQGQSQAHALPLSIRERRATLGQRQFIVTAIGPSAAFAAHSSAIDAWFATSAFDVDED